MGVYYSATPPVVQNLQVTEAISEPTYNEVGEGIITGQLRMVKEIPDFIEPEITKSPLGWYEFRFEWYQIVTDGD